MNVRDTVRLIVVVVALTFVYFLLFPLASSIAGLGSESPASPAEQQAAAKWLLVVSVANVCVLAFLIRNSAIHGWRLALTISLVLFGVITFMPQIETAVFVTFISPTTLLRIVAMGLIVSVLFPPAAVLLLGKWRPATEAEPPRRLVLSRREWAVRVGILAAVYVALYFTFGYFVAWQSAAVRAYYGGPADPGGFFTSMADNLATRPWLFGLQFLRGILWVLLAVPVINMMKGSRLTAALAVALLFSVVMNSQLLLPNPYMPASVRFPHLLETASSNFIFGCIITLVLTRKAAKSSSPPADHHAHS